MNAITLTNLEKGRIREYVLGLSPYDLKQALAKRDSEFEMAFHSATVIALTVEEMRKNCPHESIVRFPHSQFCSVCGQYIRVDTSFSKETEECFKKLRESADSRV